MTQDAYPSRPTRVGEIAPDEWQPCRIADINLLIPASDIVARRTVSEVVPAKPGRNAIGYYVLDDVVRLVYQVDRNLVPYEAGTGGDPEQPVLFVTTREGSVAGLVVDRVEDSESRGPFDEHRLPDGILEQNSFVDSVSIDSSGYFHYLTSGDAIVGRLRALLSRVTG